jgi:hypothetical protein
MACQTFLATSSSSMFNSRFLSQMASYDVASNICQALSKMRDDDVAGNVCPALRNGFVVRVLRGDGRRRGRRRAHPPRGSLHFGDPGGAVQIAPIKPKLKAPVNKRLTLEYDPISCFAFKFNLRRYILEALVSFIFMYGAVMGVRNTAVGAGGAGGGVSGPAAGRQPPDADVFLKHLLLFLGTFAAARQVLAFR